jgi:hypothetical protein
VDARPLWPGSEPGESTTHWGWLAGELGADFPLIRPFLIGIRGVAPREDETHELVARPAYDDSFVLLSPDPVPPYLFPGATHAYQLDSKLSPDVDGDGRGDVGTIRPGRFVLTLAVEKPFPIFTLTMAGTGSGNIPCFRDTDHDGEYSPAEITRSSLASAVLLHTGWDAPAASAHRSSIACQTCNASNLELVATHAKRHGGKVDYVLVDAESLIARLQRSPFAAKTPENIA